MVMLPLKQMIHKTGNFTESCKLLNNKKIATHSRSTIVKFI